MKNNQLRRRTIENQRINQAYDGEENEMAWAAAREINQQRRQIIINGAARAASSPQHAPCARIGALVSALHLARRGNSGAHIEIAGVMSARMCAASARAARIAVTLLRCVKHSA